jgi:DNA-binding NarL/FixJ family response regulator
MIQPNNAESASLLIRNKPKRHNAKRCLFRVRRRIINELVWGHSVSAIARALHISRNTVMAVREQHGG